jgi:hypothetical protein|tara:strand:+ start:3688 stop:3957 length:270 start_codon:yes stop_codon:yes gene_type:complete
MPEVLNKRYAGNSKGIYIGRGSKWGNPFSIKDYSDPADRERVIELYRKRVLPRFTAKEIAFLRGWDLLCYCAPQPCHGDLLLEAANKDG